MSPAGGTFSGAGGGTFSGTFTVDVSEISSLPAALTNVDVTTTGLLANPNEITYSVGTLNMVSAFFDGALLLGNYQLAFTSSNSTLDLNLVEQVGTFAGGEILQALETGGGANRNDIAGDAVLIDPAFVAPEPGSIGMGGMGLAILGGVWWRKALQFRARTGR